MIPSDLLLCAGSLATLGLAAGVIIALRYLSYRQAIALAEKGFGPESRSRDGKDALRWGILLAALGTALCLGLYPLGAGLPGRYPLGFGPWMLLGLIPLFFGLGLLLIYALSREKK